ncbi:hypothetical protein HMPREF2767_00325 [Nosocomiicoccus sp. HMSC067E10]|uniref:ApeA N-terminal domain 1-containing protein n=1 Tax=Nosocomiicoccus sp. HMSC067E10 TaxID=1739271 RepID=UPI0008A5E581|nr:hypothetical protein [Nosocomiicoccus sp. HMSC067E10]OFL49831.1 hypothetical protein HMPREF2767_00325 [Nosocomiicoccus sp. HMSC067E10]
MKFSKIEMDDKISLHGVTFIQENEPISSLLEYDDGHIELTFIKLADSYMDLDPNIENVKFVSSYGENIFLKNGIFKNITTNSRGVRTYSIIYEYLFLLISSRSNKEIDFKEFCTINLNYTDLNSFLNKEMISFLQDIIIDETSSFSSNEENLYTEFNYDNYELSVSDTYKIIKNIDKNNSTFRINFRPQLMIKTKEEIDFEDILGLIFKFRNILSFIFDKKLKTKEIFLENRTCKLKIFWSKEFGIKETIAKRNIDYKKEFFVRNFSEIINGYFKNSDKLRDIFEIYVNNLYVVHYYADSYLLSQISIMEGLHRRFISEKEKHLRKRLIEVFKFVDDDVKEKIYKANGINLNVKVEDIALYLKKFRNYHSHYGYNKPKKKIEIEDHDLISFLRDFSREFILKNIGVSESLIGCMPENYPFKQLNSNDIEL